MIRKHLMQGVLLIISIVLLIGIAVINIKKAYNEKSELSGFRLASDDRCISVAWDEVSIFSVQSVEITITGEEYTKTVSLNPLYAKEYLFYEGTHGNLYTFSINLSYRDGTLSEIQEKNALFLDYDKLPQDVPLLQITTDNYAEPEAEYVGVPEEGLWGATIINNEYVKGTMTLTGNGKNVSTGVEVRIRGNTSAYSDKKPYKLTLDQPIDLINGDGNNADTDWILMAYTGTNLNTYLGSYIGTLCGMEWQPRMKFVNVMVNGDWKGCYLLIESVKRSSTRLDIEETGYIFENDAYWWNSNDIYFKTENQWKPLGFTFKYPNITSAEDARISYLQSYMQEAENAILGGETSISDCLDINSWVAWVMGRDLLGHGDGGGSNIYYYIYDLSSSDESDKKIYMGPLWDFDAAFTTTEGWSTQHRAEYLYFAYLMDNSDFREAYEDKWKSLSADLLENIMSYADELYNEQGTGLEESRTLDSVRWQVERTSLKDEIESDRQFFTAQITWIDQQISAELE